MSYMKNLLASFEELPQLITDARKAIDGDSGDAEMEALYAFMEWAINLLTDSNMGHLLPAEAQP